MIAFTKFNMAYAICICILFGINIGSFTWVSRTDNMCPKYFANATSLCYAAIGGVSAGIAGLSWPFLPDPARAIVSISATMVTRSPFQVQMAILTYLHMLPVVEHIFKVWMVPIQTAECIKEETVYSLQLVKRSLFGESHVDTMNRGIKDVVATYGKVKDRQQQYRDEIERMFEWLESKGLTCQQVLLIPFQECNKTYQDWIAKCWDNGWVSVRCAFQNIKYGTEWAICKVLEPLGRAACGIFSQERITDMLVSIRMKLEDAISAAIRLRIGVRFELTTTHYVGAELSKAWEPVKAFLRGGAKASSWLFTFLKNFLLHNVGFLFFVCYPICYWIAYMFGPLKFDNRYIPTEEEYRQYARFKEDDPEEIRWLPLVMGEETEKYQMVPQWCMMPNEAVKLIKSLTWTGDLIAFGFLMIYDYYMTVGFGHIYYGTVNLFNRYQGSIFELTYDQDAKGMRVVGQVIVEQLDNLQHAAGLGRLIGCARQPPPIKYGYYIYSLCVFWRLIWLYSSVKLGWLPSMLCARFYRARHRQRMRTLKAETLLNRRDFERPHKFPWLRALFRTCCQCECLDCVDQTCQGCGVDLQETFNL